MSLDLILLKKKMAVCNKNCASEFRAGILSIKTVFEKNQEMFEKCR